MKTFAVFIRRSPNHFGIRHVFVQANNDVEALMKAEAFLNGEEFLIDVKEQPEWSM